MCCLQALVEKVLSSRNTGSVTKVRRLRSLFKWVADAAGGLASALERYVGPRRCGGCDLMPPVCTVQVHQSVHFCGPSCDNDG